MSTTISTLTSFTASSLTTTTPTPRVWHLDVPLTYPTPPLGHQLTVTLVSPHPLAPAADACPDLVIACAGGVPVWVAEVTQAGAPASLPMALLRHEGTTQKCTHLTAAHVRVIDLPIHALRQPEQASLAQAIAAVSDTSNDPGPGILGAATQLDAPTSQAVSALLALSIRPAARAAEHEAMSATASVPRRATWDAEYCWCGYDHAQPYWAIEVPHNYSPPSPHVRLTVFVMTVGHHRPMRPGDLVFAFARGKLVQVARATGTGTPAELKVSIETSADPKDHRAYVTTADVEILELDLQNLYDEGDEFVLHNLDIHLTSLFPRRQDRSFGDARPFEDWLGTCIASTLDLLNDEEPSTNTWTTPHPVCHD